ncbi:hypothetical protein [Brevibacillus nitrificans]|uniref:hypothetical protein n=1 Tax=Brevibacillus nitrificans TaxID=651560 RepID=UPI00285EB89B|nr:hypothetical protein [Brevibacillus nitrificans]MDR7316963.1 ABC-type oligopeptide transport system substrate-binding subunit [Brevibacillus nitrificans]
MKRSFAIMSVLVLLTGLFAGCSNNNTSQPQSSPSASQTDQANAEPQILRMNAAEPETLDSGMSNDVISGAFIRSLYDSLVRLDKDGKPVNSVASDIKISDDKKVYTFTLRDSKWSGQSKSGRRKRRLGEKARDDRDQRTFQAVGLGA